ncbi:hypothetical protein GH714_020468 [Hevea brasiliensis]|uniref:Alpha/beta hydrolase fold-3 domain-containing protein n=1 Tax=Hevea brasiliensis TaxID=3981 RepID=A0A6A6L8H7_HEVBR|nr:hypothetical protein GH714_020468 [Hevea brasiliensis]
MFCQFQQYGNAYAQGNHFIQSTQHSFTATHPRETKMAQNDDPQWPDLPWNVKLFISALSFSFDITRRSNGTVNRFLMGFFDLRTSPSRKPINGVKTTDITVDKARNLWFRLYTRPPPPEMTLVLAGRLFSSSTAVVLPSWPPVLKLLMNFATALPGNSPLSSSPLTIAYLQSIVVLQYEDGFDTLKFIDTAKIEGFSGNANLKQCFIAGDSAGASWCIM